MINWRQVRSERQKRGRPFVMAHRGVPVLEPENTVRSFALALQQGADVLETDLRFTRDNQIVLFHDRLLARTTDGQGALHDQPLHALKRLRTRAPNGSLTDAEVPTLLDLIEYTQGQIPFLLELKDPLFADPKHAEQLIELLETHGVLQSSAIVSFHPDYVAAVKTVCSAMPTGNITLWNPLPSGHAQLLGPIWPLLCLNPGYVVWAHRLNKIVAPLDPTPEQRMWYYMKLGVDAVLADHPATVIAAIDQYQRRPA
ncbi:MAG: glycerophosphodiester phosphodiesterase [Chloroflexi bacterium]|nr:glycerophosphodiester phosphodiesterase [Chloroflexota bacterium]